MMIVGRLFVLVMIGVSVIWIPAIDKMQGGLNSYLYIQSISSNLAPPIASVYLLAILWKRTNEQVGSLRLAIVIAMGNWGLLRDSLRDGL